MNRLLGVLFLYSLVQLSLSWITSYFLIVLGLVLGVLLILPIGGADMPVIVSMLNSYSGWAAAGIGSHCKTPLL